MNGKPTYKGRAYEALHRRKEVLRWMGVAISHGFALEIAQRKPELASLLADPAFSQPTRKKVR